MNTLELRHIRKSFDGQGVLEDISLSVPAGSVTAIIGPSGSGKSTLLRCATLLETADGGDIIYEGKYAAKDGVYAPKAELHAIRRYFGLVFQSYNLFPHFTLLKNVMDAPAQVQKRPAAEVREEAMALLGKMGLADRADAYPCQLSGGQQQRAAIARALCMKPELLFFDEPTSALDPELTASFGELVQLPDYNTGFLELRQGTVDAVVVDVGVGNYQIANTEGDYVILSEPVSVEQYAVGFYLGNEALRDAVNEQLLAMAEDGTMMSIAEKYVDKGLSLDSLCLCK